jgi:hypothetical protein
MDLLGSYVPQFLIVFQNILAVYFCQWKQGMKIFQGSPL